MLWRGATEGANNTLDYTFNYGSTPTSIKASVNDNSNLTIFTVTAGNGARVFNGQFSVDILEVDIQSAYPDSYTATIVFEYVAE